MGDFYKFWIYSLLTIWLAGGLALFGACAYAYIRVYIKRMVKREIKRLQKNE